MMWLRSWAFYLVMVLAGWLSGACLGLSWAFAGVARAAKRRGQL